MEYRGNYVASSIVALLKRLCHRCFQGNFAEIMKPLEAVISYKIPRETLSIVASYIWGFFSDELDHYIVCIGDSVWYDGHA